MFLNDGHVIVSNISNIILYSPGESFHRAPPSLPTYELQYCTEGENKIKFDGKSILMSKGKLLYLPKGTDNKEYTYYSSEDYVAYTIYFDALQPMPTEPIIIDAPTDTGRIFKAAFKEWIRKTDSYLYTCMKLFYSILEKTSLESSRYSTKNQLKMIQPSIEYMQMNYCNKDFDYNEMHRRSGLSYTYYKELFIRKYGMPPVKYVTRIKLERACELLSTQNFSVSDVARLCGFESVYYFSAIFKKHYGCSPKYHKEQL